MGGNVPVTAYPDDPVALKPDAPVTAYVFVDRFPRCRGRRKDGSPCRRLLAELVSRPWRIVCRSCKTLNEGVPITSDGRPLPDWIKRLNL